VQRYGKRNLYALRSSNQWDYLEVEKREGINTTFTHKGGALKMREPHSELGDVARTSPRNRKSKTPLLSSQLMIPWAA